MLQLSKILPEVHFDVLRHTKISITWLNRDTTVINHSTRDSSQLKLSLGFKNKDNFLPY